MQTTAEKKAYQRQWYLAHRDTEQAKARDRAAANRAAGTVPERTPEERKRFWDRWYSRNRDQRRAYMATRGEANREASRRYWDAHRTELRRKVLERYHHRRAPDARRVTDVDWTRLVTRFDGRCAYCRRQGRMTEDHVIPISRGGRHTIGNLVPACQPCNQRKGLAA